ncbi:MAG: hypothetical protein IAE85_09205 [Anaerolinea sp.]|nr:hypothetical protein [Anaerolinea sp.]
MFALFVVLVYLAGIPFAAGVIGEKCGKGDWAFAAFIGLMSWAGTGLFVGMMLAMFAATKIYNAGMWASERLGDLDW